MSWHDSTLGELAERDGGLIQTGPFGSQLHQSDYVSDGIPVIMPKDIADGRVSTESVARIAEETADRLERHKLKPRTIVLPRRGEVTKRAFIRSDQDGWLCGTGCLKIELQGKYLLPEFLYYFMEQSHVVRWLEQNAVGTTMLNLSAGVVRNPCCGFERDAESNKILGHDDRHAFVAVIRLMKLAPKRTSLNSVTFHAQRFQWAPFPPLRNAVRDASVLVAGEAKADEPLAVELARRILQQRHPPPIGLYKSVVGREDRSNFALRLNTWITDRKVPEDLANKLGRHRMIVGDTVYGRRGDIGRRAFIGKRQEGWFCGTGCLRIRPDPAAISPRYLFDALGSPETAGIIANRAKRATMPNLNGTLLRSVPVLVAPRKLQDYYSAYVEPSFEMLDVLDEQNHKLRAARDLLLPRLMSGEIAV